ncbi:MAG: GntR family transcriptional regulator [Beijerinckiaceae bacterium]
MISDHGRLNHPLDRSSPLPLYAQIKQRLIGMVANWDRPDRRFYSDEELCEQFLVSRDTVRQALSELVREGLLTRSRGLGTFVSIRKVQERFEPGMNFLQQWAANGTPMQPKVLAFERRPADAAVANLLEVPPGEMVLEIRRVRSAAGVPVAIDYRFLPAHLAPDWDESAALASPLHLLWKHIRLREGEFEIEAASATPEEVEYLHLSPGAPVLVRNLRYRDIDGRLVLAGRTIHRADLVRYSLSVPLLADGRGNITLAPAGGVHDD